MSDGKLRAISSESDVRVGNVVRIVESDGNISAFADGVITAYDMEKDVYVVSRPYLYASGSDVTPHISSPLVGFESTKVSFSSLKRYYKLVLTDRENPFNFGT